MIAIAEESNNLEKVLLKVSDSLERRTTRTLELVVKLIEPLMLFVMASVIGTVNASGRLRVLDAFSPARPELSLADISRTTGLPPATLYRLLRELTGHGAIQRTSTGR